MTIAAGCLLGGTGTLTYRDVTVPATAAAYPFAASLTPALQQTPTAFTPPVSVTVTVSSHLYWASSGDGTISEANPDGTSPHVIVTGQVGADSVAVNGSHLYWTSFDSPGTISEASLDGTDPQTIVTGQDQPVALAVSP